ncbi:MAG: hypothetical protein JST16_02880 [Bdellovibrionales bacterium]|nr:hypothetical protein [Bdellovibrionales bacterium]
MDHVRHIKGYIQTLLKSESIHALLVKGAAGLGKSLAVEAALEQLGHKPKSLGSYSTPLNLFNFLAENAHGQIVLVDDTSANLFQSPSAMAILKAATGTTDGPRRVVWGSTRAAISTPEFDFQSKIIFICNSFPATPDGSAILSRAMSYRLHFSAAEASALLTSAAGDKNHYRDSELAAQVAAFLNSHRTRENSDQINLRTLKVGYDVAQVHGHGEWQELLLRLLPASKRETEPPLKVLQELLNSKLPVVQQEREFIRRTGLTRRTYFRLKNGMGLTRTYSKSQ